MFIVFNGQAMRYCSWLWAEAKVTGRWPKGMSPSYTYLVSNFHLLEDNSLTSDGVPSGKDYDLFIPPPNEVGGGVNWIHLIRPSVRPSVCRRHGFRSISQVCFGISIPNFICMLMVAITRSLLIFSDVTFKMAAWRPYWIFLFPDSNFTLALNINFKLQRHNTYVYR